jgi:cytoskeletal protein CcmA (bactofilin family)
MSMQFSDNTVSPIVIEREVDCAPAQNTVRSFLASALGEGHSFPVRFGMTGSSVGLFGDLARLLLIVVALFGLCAATAEGQITWLRAAHSAKDVANAKTALQNGGVIAMQDVRSADFSGIFNVGIATRRTAGAASASYCVIGAAYDASHVLHSYRGAMIKNGTTDSQCMLRFEKWANAVNTLQASARPNALVTATPSNGPPAAAWTALQVNTDSDTESNNLLQVTYSIYRANSNFGGNDWYMIFQQVDTQPDYDHCLAGSYCGWLTSSRNLQISATDANGNNYPIFDHGPLSQNNVTTASFSVGASTSGFSGGVSGGFGESWSQSDVTTVDDTNLTTNVAQWKDSFRQFGHFSPSSPSDPPPAVKGLWESYQSVIFSVPVGTSSFNININDQAGFIYFHPFTTDTTTAQVLDTVTVTSPTISVTPVKLRLVPGQQNTLAIDAEISGQGAGQLGWTLSNPDTSNNINLSTTTGTGSQTVIVSVPTGTQPGTEYLNVDTMPSYSSIQTKSGPLKIEVDVVSASTVAPGVLLTGGTDWTGSPVNSAELWSPSTGTSTAVGNMLTQRYLHTATPIANDRVLIVGGLDGNYNPVTPTEIYDEASQIFTPGPNLQIARSNHTATRLNDGTVLIVGGIYNNNTGVATAGAEIFDPVQSTTTSVGSMTYARFGHTAALLQGGTVLICGGSPNFTPGGGVDVCEIYSPTTRTFTVATATQQAGFVPFVATVLTTGQVVEAASPAINFMQSVGIYTPSSAAMQFTDGLDYTALNSALVTLPNSGAMILGGSGLTGSSMLWNNNAQNFYFIANMVEQRANPQAVYLQNTNTALDGSVVVLGGIAPNTGTSNGLSVEANNPSAYAWSAVGSLIVPRSNATATQVFAPLLPSLALTASSTSATYGTTINLTATIAATGIGIDLNGIITFYDGATSLGAVTLANGTAAFSASTFAIGTHNITAAYSGGVQLQQATSQAVKITIAPNVVPSTISDLVTPATVPYGTASVLLTGLVSSGTTANPVYPQNGEQVSITIGTANATAVTGANGVSGSFSIYFPVNTLDAGTYSIQYAYSGDSQLKPTTMAGGSLIISPLSPVFTVPASSTVSAASSASVTGSIAAGTSIPSGTVGISVNNGAPVSATIQSNGSFTAVLPTTALAVGSYPLAYSFAGVTNYNPANGTGTLTVTAVPTSATLSSTLAPSSYGQQVTFTATVSGSAPDHTPSGTVTFFDGSTSIGTGALASGVATLPISTLTVANHSITASYGGDAIFATSTTAPFLQTVNALSPTFTVAPSSAVNAGSDASVNGSISAGASIPSGSVAVSVNNGTPVMATILPDGTFTASLTTSALASGTYSLGYSFPGNVNFHAATSSATLTVNAVASTIAVTSSLNPSPYGQQVAFTASVSGSITGRAPSGVVTFLDGATTLGTGTLANGQASFSSNTLTVAVHPITVSYAGDSMYAASTSTVLPQTISTLTPQFTISASPSVDAGSNATITGSIAAGASIPSGSVSVSVNNGTAVPATIQSNGSFTATLPTSTLAIGSYPLSYTYEGSATFNTASNVATKLAVNAVASSTALTSSLNPSSYGQQVTFTATVSGPASDPAPSGTVTFLDGLTTLGTATLSGGQATYASSILTAGAHSITASYSGNAIYAISSATALAQTITALTPVFTVSSANSVNAGSNGSVTGSIAAGTFIPTGSISVSVNDGAAASATIQPDGSFTANLSTSTLPTGSYALSYSFVGNTNFAPATNSVTKLTVTAVSSSTTLTSSLNPAPYGQPVAFTATVSGSASGHTPSGTVTFLDGTTTLGSAALNNGQATYPGSALGAATHSITAAYSGDSIYAVSNAAALLQVVTQLAPTLTVPASPSVNVGGNASVSGSIAAGSVIPSGSLAVSVNSGTPVPATIQANGSFTANLPTSALGAGTYPLLYTFAGSTNFSAVTNGSTSLTVIATGPAVSQLTLTVLPSPMTVGQSVTFTATVLQVNGFVPTGNVSFSETVDANGKPLPNGGFYYGNADLVNGVATLTPTGTSAAYLTAGVHVLVATYGGDNGVHYTSATSPFYNLTVNAGLGTPDGGLSLSVPTGSSTVTVKQGGAAIFPLTITPTSGFSGSVTLTCVSTSAVSNIGCVVPPAFSLTGDPQTVNIVVTTETTAVGTTAKMALSLGGLCLMSLAFKRNRRMASLLMLVLMGTIASEGCGTQRPNTGLVLPGSYDFTITATGTSRSAVNAAYKVTVVVVE